MDASFLTDGVVSLGSSTSVDTTAAPSSALDGGAGINWDNALSKILDTYVATETLDAKTQQGQLPAGYYRVPGTQTVLPAGQVSASAPANTMTMMIVAAALVVGAVVLLRVVK